MELQSPVHDTPAGHEADGTPFWYMEYGGVTTARVTRKVHGRKPGEPTHLEQARAYLALTPEERAIVDAGGALGSTGVTRTPLPIGSRFD